jgi:hypothetical protein
MGSARTDCFGRGTRIRLGWVAALLWAGIGGVRAGRGDLAGVQASDE